MDSSWCHIGFSIERVDSSNNITIYKNGNKIKTDAHNVSGQYYYQDITIGGEFDSSKNSLYDSSNNNWDGFGRTRGPSTNNFKGIVKNIVLLNRAVSQEEMINLMFSGKDNSSAFHGELRHMKIYDETIDINEINKHLSEPYFMNHWKLTDASGQDSIANTTNASLNHVVVTESECIFDGSGDYIDLGENISFKHDFEQDMLNVPEKTKNGFTFALWMRYTTFTHKKDYYQGILDELEKRRLEALKVAAMASSNLITTTEELNHKKNIAHLASNMKTTPMNVEILKNLPALRRRVKGRCVFNDEVRDAVRKGTALTNYEIEILQEIVTTAQEEKSIIDTSYNIAKNVVNDASNNLDIIENTSLYLVDLVDASRNNRISISNHNTSTDAVFKIIHSDISGVLHVVDLFGESGEWQHLVFTADETGLMKVYKNGLLVDEGMGVAPNTNVHYEGFLGKDISGTEVTFFGSLRDVRLYRRAMDLSSIQSIYWDEFSKPYIYPGLSDDFRTYTPMLDPSSQLLLDTSTNYVVEVSEGENMNWSIQTSPFLIKGKMEATLYGLGEGAAAEGDNVVQDDAKGTVITVVAPSTVEVKIQAGTFDISGVVLIGDVGRGAPTKVVTRDIYEDLQYRVFFQDLSGAAGTTALDASCNEGNAITFICGSGNGGDFKIEHNENLRNASDTFQIYDTSNNTFSVIEDPAIMPKIWATSVYMKPKKYKGFDWVQLADGDDEMGRRVEAFEKIFIFGGSTPVSDISGSHNRTKDVQIYDILNDTWTVEENRLDYAVAGATAVAVLDRMRIYIIGGDETGQKIQIYRPEMKEINCVKGRIWKWKLDGKTIEECIWDPNKCVFCPELCVDKNIAETAEVLAEKCKSKCAEFHSDVKIANNRIEKLKVKHCCHAFGGFLFATEATSKMYKKKVLPLPTTDVIGGWNKGDILIEVVDISKFNKGNIVEINGKRRIIVEKYDTVFEGKKKYYIQMNEPL